MSQNESRKSYNGLTNVNDDFIVETHNTLTESNNAKRIRKVRLLSLVTCFVLLFCTVTVLATTGWGTSIIDMFTSRTEPGSDFSESGYDLSIKIEKIPVNQLSGDVRGVSDIIVQQFRNSKPYDNWYSGHWQKSFSSSTEAIEFVGIYDLRALDWDLEERSITLNVTGNTKGEILFLQLETCYEIGDIRLQASSHVFTEDYDNEVTYGARTTEDIVFAESYYTTTNQLQCHIITSTALESGYSSMDGYIIQDSILYNLHIAYLENDAKQAEELLYQWAALFNYGHN